MKNINIVKLLFLTFIAGCLQPLNAQQRSEKREISESGFNYEEEITALSPGVSWYYNWAITPPYMLEDVVGPGKEMEFCPMIWNGNFDEQDIREYLTNNPGVKYLLGFNEPNFIKQANMTPKEAAELWTVLENIAKDFDLELIAPALNYSPDAPYSDPEKWYDEFFELLPEGAKVDYLALHCYMIGADAMMSFIDGIAEKYNKQVWLTEFCAWDDLTKDPEQARTIQRDQMVRKVETLELSPNVARYSWFKAKGADSYPYYPLLYYRNESQGIAPGTLTDLGEIYVYMSSFDQDCYYYTEDTIPATNYVRSDYVTVEQNTDLKSPCRLQISTFGIFCSADYLIDVEEAGEYYLNIRIASKDSLFNPFIEVYTDGKKIAGQELEKTGSVTKWGIRAIPVNLPAGKQRLMLKSTKNTTCKINWIKLSREDLTTAITQETYIESSLFIRQQTGSLAIESETPVQKIVLMDMSGRPLASVTGQKEVSTIQLNEGVYLIQIVLANGMNEVRKCVISK